MSSGKVEISQSTKITLGAAAGILMVLVPSLMFAISTAAQGETNKKEIAEMKANQNAMNAQITQMLVLTAKTDEKVQFLLNSKLQK
jgi:predicted RND superfamily exporter protein